MLARAIDVAGFSPRRSLISLDIAATEFRDDGRYAPGPANVPTRAAEWIDVLSDGWRAIPSCRSKTRVGRRRRRRHGGDHRCLGDRVQIIGDDYLVTNAARISSAVARKACNAGLAQAEPGGHRHRDDGALLRGARRALGHHRVGAFGRNRRHDDRAPRRRLGCRPAQGWILRSVGAHGQVERMPAHRARAWRRRRYRGCRSAADGYPRRLAGSRDQ